MTEHHQAPRSGEPTEVVPSPAPPPTPPTPPREGSQGDATQVLPAYGRPQPRTHAQPQPHAHPQPYPADDAWPGNRRPVTSRPRTSPAARIGALLVALAAAAGVAVTWRLLVLSPRGQLLDGTAVDGAVYGQGTLWQLAEAVLDVVSVGFVVVALGGAMLVALLRRRWGLALQVAVLVVGANITTQILKWAILDRPDYGITTGTLNSLPSGHTTVAASVSMAVLMVVPRGGRAFVAVLGAAYTGATGIATMVGQWHRPSDVVAAVLVVLAWTALVGALTPRSGLDPRPGATVSTAVGAAFLGAAAVLLGIVCYAVLNGSDLPVVGAATADPAVRAYVGTTAGVAAVTAASFAAALLVRQSTARGSDG